MNSLNDEVLRKHVQLIFTKNDMSHNGYLAPDYLHIYVNQIFLMSGLTRTVNNTEAITAWRSSEPRSVSVSRAGLYNTVKELYWVGSNSHVSTVFDTDPVPVHPQVWIPPPAVVETQTTTRTGPVYSAPPSYYVPPAPPTGFVETTEQTTKKKKGIGFEINFLGFDFGTGFNRGTKTTTETHKRWFH